MQFNPTSKVLMAVALGSVILNALAPGMLTYYGSQEISAAMGKTYLALAGLKSRLYWTQPISGKHLSARAIEKCASPKTEYERVVVVLYQLNSRCQNSNGGKNGV